MDASTYVPDQTDMIEVTDTDGDNNVVPCNFGPVLFDVMNAMADDVGEMQFIIGLSMQHPSDDTSNVELVKAAREKMGPRLDALLLGNEPDVYTDHAVHSSYSIQDYISDVNLVLGDLEEKDGNITNTKTIAGPSVCCNWDLADVLEDGLTKLPYKYYT